MRRISKKRQKRQAEAKPIRDALIRKVGECEICGASPSRPKHGLPWNCSQLCCHEIANGPHRQAALDKPFAILVLCWNCNGQKVTDKGKWPEARQLAVLARSRPEDFDLAAFCRLINPNAPDRVTLQEVLEHMIEIKGLDEVRLLNPQEVALIMQVNRKTVWSWINNQELRAIDVSSAGSTKRQWRIEPADLIRFARNRGNLAEQVDDVTFDDRVDRYVEARDEARKNMK